jgi:hypothetical protein
MPSTIHTSNIFMSRLDVKPLLTSCSNTQASCQCTDPSYIYTTPCSLKSTTGEHTGRSKCYYGSAPTSAEGIRPSTATTTFTDPVFKVNPPGSGGKQAFTNTGGTTYITGAYNTYPKSLMFCANPGTGNADITNATPNLGYDADTSSFTSWDTQPKTAAPQTNIGFDPLN